MSCNLLARCRRAAVLFALLSVAQPVVHAADKQRKAKETEAKRLISLGKAAEKQGHLLDARAQYLASEHVLFTQRRRKGPRACRGSRRRAGEGADDQRGAGLRGGELHEGRATARDAPANCTPAISAIGCNLGLTRYQQGKRDDALALLDECVGGAAGTRTRGANSRSWTPP